MGLNLGNTNIGEIYLGNTKITEAYLGSSKIYSSGPPVDPYNPLNLPPNTVRIRTNDGIPNGGIYDSVTLVPGTTNVYDVYKSGTNLSNLLSMATNLIEVLGANTTGITDIHQMLYRCTSLTSVSLFDTSSVTDMTNTFADCSSLRSVPLFNTSSVNKMNFMFQNCTNVESGALALYQQASTQTTPPSKHSSTFRNCGRDTTTGAAELAQIPSGWK